MKKISILNNKFFLFLFGGCIFLLTSFIFSEQTIVDYDIISGNKALVPLVETKSKIGFAIDKESIQDKFSSLDYEEQKSGVLVTTIVLKKNDQKIYEFNDTNINGKFDIWKVYKDNKINLQMKLDEEKNLISEKIVYSNEGDIIEVYLDKNNKGFYNEKNIYNKGSIIKTYKDKDGDGLFELEISYLTEEVIINEIKKSIKVDHFHIKNLYIGGFYRLEEYPVLDKKFTKMMFNELKDTVKNEYSDVEKYYSKIQKNTSIKKLEKKYFNRFNLFSVIFDKNKNKSTNSKIKKSKKIKGKKDKQYILIGDILETKNRIRVYYRIIGPNPLDNVMNKFIQKPIDESKTFSLKDIVAEIKQDLDEAIIFTGDKNYSP